MTIVRWEKLGEEPLRVGYRRIKRVRFRFPDGHEDRYDLMDEGRVACTLALTPQMNVILARQYRPGPDEILLEMPGGGVEPEETPEQAARRELLEETGYEGDFQLAGEAFHCGYSSRRRFSFVATGCRKARDQALDRNELIEVFEVPLADFREYLRAGRLTDVGSGYQCLDFLGLL